MRRLARRTGFAIAVAGAMLGATGLPAVAQDTPPSAAGAQPGAQQPPAAQPAVSSGVPATGAQPQGAQGAGGPPAAQQPAGQGAGAPQSPSGQPDVFLTASLHADELRFNEPPQASLQVVVQPNGRPLVDLQLQNVPNAPQAGTTYRDVSVRLTVSGTLADVALGAAGAGPAPGAPSPAAGAAAAPGASSAPDAPAP